MGVIAAQEKGTENEIESSGEERGYRWGEGNLHRTIE